MQGRGEKWEASNEAAVIGTVRKRREIENQKKKREEENMSLKNNKYARRLAAALMTGAMMLTEITEMTAMKRQNSRLLRGRRMRNCKTGLLSTRAQTKSARHLDAPR